jgi:hypothetical protein
MPRIVPLTAEYLDAVRAFNDRMRHSGNPAAFDLPEFARGDNAGDRLVRSTDYIIADDDSVRGGILAVDAPAWLNGADAPVSNYQSPLSEGLIDRRYATLGVMLARFAEKRSPLAYMVGMGSEASPLARLLIASGWSIGLARFQFRVHRAGRFLQNLRLAHASPLRSALSTVARWTGAGAAGLAILQRGKASSSGFSSSVEKQWGEWADQIWTRFRAECSFALRRDRAALEELFPPDPRLVIIRADRNGSPAGWAACFDTQMNAHPHFGDLRVGAILDCAAAPEAMAATAALADLELARRGVDLVLTNQTHHRWIEAFAAAGFLNGPSNYVVALSRALAATVCGRDSIHVTRGDGDGRIHL